MDGEEMLQGSGKVRSKDLERKGDVVKAAVLVAQNRPSVPLVAQRTHTKPTSGHSGQRELVPRQLR